SRAMNHLVALVQPLNVPFAPLGPASGNPPPPPPPPMPTSTNEGGEEDDDDDNEDDEEDNDVNDVSEAAQQSNPGVDASGRESRSVPGLRFKINFYRTKTNAQGNSGQIQQASPRISAQHPDDAGAQNAAKVAIRNQQSVEARKVSRKEKKKEKRKAAKK
ncbi:hypothetical protein LTR20_003963, partial [Exophiala xenobiotica]